MISGGKEGVGLGGGGGQVVITAPVAGHMYIAIKICLLEIAGLLILCHSTSTKVLNIETAL